MPGCGNQNMNLKYVQAGRPGIALRLIGGGGGSNSEDSITSTDEDLSFNTP